MTLLARRMILISALLACLGGGLAGAQDKPADTMELLREEARADKKLVVATALNLNRVSNFLDTFAQAYGSMTDAIATKLLAEFLALAIP